MTVNLDVGQSKGSPALAPGVDKCRAAMDSYLRRTAPERMAAVWVSMTIRERAFWMRSVGANDLIERGAHCGPWDVLAANLQDALLDAWHRSAKRAQAIEAAIAGRAAQ